MGALFNLKQNVAFASIAVIGVTGIGGAAYAATTATTTAPAATAPAAKAAHAKAAHHRAKSLLSRADRATVEIKVKGAWVTYGIDRGKVTAVSPTSVTLALADGQSVTEAIASTTKFGGVSGASAVTVGKPAMVVSQGATATRIVQRAATATPAS
jgi:hypothetical protein